jgi:predicted small secreted protein
MKALMIALFGFFALSLSACNTIGGAGQDVQAAGQAVQEVAKDAKPK